MSILRPDDSEFTQEQLIALLGRRIQATEMMTKACFPDQSGAEPTLKDAIDCFMEADLHIYAWWRAKYADNWLEMAKKAPLHERPVWIWGLDTEGDFHAMEAI